MMIKRKLFVEYCKNLGWTSSSLFLSFSSLQVIFESLLLKNTMQYCFQKSIKETKMLSQIFRRQVIKRTSIHKVGLYIHKCNPLF